jgi:Holliday junction resolvasome RuvABC ATP-dependent DNA helicase subunit
MTEKLKHYVPRNDVEASLKKILTADEVSNYWVISGEHGTGKTTTVQKVCHEIGKGIIYVDVPKDVDDFKDALAKAIGLTYRHHSGLWSFIHQSVYGREPLPGMVYY